MIIFLDKITATLHNFIYLCIYINVKKMKLIRVIDNYINEKNFSMIYKNNSLDVINYTEILDFSSSLIRIRDNNRKYDIEGNNLVISKMMDDELLVTGDINRVTFL